MSFKRLLGPTNMRARLGVGVILAALFCIRCAPTGANRSADFVVPVDGQALGQSSAQVHNDLEKLARTDHVALLKMALEHYKATYQDYTCTFIKQERLNGVLGPEQWIDVKFREQPFSVAMKWTKNAPLGEGLLYVEGRYNGQMLVQPKGFLKALTGGAVLRDPAGREAMANTLRPVTMFGFRKMMENLLGVYEEAGKRGEAANTFLGYGDVSGRRVLMLRRDLPNKNNYPAKVTVWYLDVDYLLPLGMKAYDWDNGDEPSCSYVYKDLKLNVGLTNGDFSPESNGMKYSGK